MRKILSVLFFFGLFVFPSLAHAESQLLDQVVAVVNSEVITESELDSYLQPVYEQMKAQFKGQTLAEKLGEARSQLLNQMIEDKLVYQEAEKQDVKIDPSEIEAEIEQVKNQAPKGKDFEEVLHAQGLSMKDLRDRIKRQLMIRRLHDQEVRSKIIISPAEIDAFYQENSDEFSRNERVKIRSITLRKSAEAQEKGMTDEAKLRQIKDLRKQAASGRDFAELAKKYSEDTRAQEGGLSDWINHGEMIADIDKIIFTAKKGEITDVIETPLGYHVFRIEEHEKAVKKTLEEVRDPIYNILYHKKFQEQFAKWLAELKRNAYISIR